MLTNLYKPRAYIRDVTVYEFSQRDGFWLRGRTFVWVHHLKMAALLSLSHFYFATVDDFNFSPSLCSIDSFVIPEITLAASRD